MPGDHLDCGSAILLRVRGCVALAAIACVSPRRLGRDERACVEPARTLTLRGEGEGRGQVACERVRVGGWYVLLTDLDGPFEAVCRFGVFSQR